MLGDGRVLSFQQGDLKATWRNTLHLQENSMDLEANQDLSGIDFKYENERTKEFKKNQ
jgi:hypothetical protein